MTELYGEENRRLRAIDLVIEELSNRKNRSMRLQIESATWQMGKEVDDFYEEILETARVIRQSYV